MAPKLIFSLKFQNRTIDRKAIQLSKWSSRLGKYSPTDFGRDLGLVPMSGMRIMKWLDESRCRYILRMVKMHE